MARDPYEVLGIPPDASLREARSAHRRLAEIYHPDRYADSRAEVQAEAAARMKELNDAWARVQRTSRAGSAASNTAPPKRTAEPTPRTAATRPAPPAPEPARSRSRISDYVPVAGMAVLLVVVVGVVVAVAAQGRSSDTSSSAPSESDGDPDVEDESGEDEPSAVTIPVTLTTSSQSVAPSGPGGGCTFSRVRYTILDVEDYGTVLRQSEGVPDSQITRVQPYVCEAHFEVTVPYAETYRVTAAGVGGDWAVSDEASAETASSGLTLSVQADELAPEAPVTPSPMTVERLVQIPLPPCDLTGGFHVIMGSAEDPGTGTELQAVVGDLTGDGIADGAYTTVCNGGGSGVLFNTYAFDSSGELLGELPVYQDAGQSLSSLRYGLRIGQGTISVVAAGPVDCSACEPDGYILLNYRWNGAGFDRLEDGDY